MSLKKMLGATGLAFAVLASALPLTQVKLKAEETTASTPPIAAYNKQDWSKMSWAKDKDKPVSLEWFLAFDWASPNFDPQKNLFDKDFLEHTGITINWSYGNLEKLNTLVATNSLPDIVTLRMDSPTRIEIEKTGQALPLDELQEKYAPEYKVPQSMKDWFKSEDGHWYSHASYYLDLDQLAEREMSPSHNMIYARYDLMKELGITAKEMRTKDGLVNALKKVKEANLEYKGQKVEPWLGGDTFSIAEMFGMDRVDKDGNLADPYMQPEYKEAVLFVNRLFREGIINDEAFTRKLADARRMSQTGAVFAGMPKWYVELKTDLYKENNKALMGPVGILKGDSGKQPIMTPHPTGGWTGTLISSNCKHPERAIQLFNYFSQPDVSLSLLNGWNAYTVNEKGKVVPKQEVLDELAKDSTLMAAKYTSQGQTFFGDTINLHDYVDRGTLSSELITDEVSDLRWHVGHIYDHKMFVIQLPIGSEEAVRGEEINAYVEPTLTQIYMAGSEEEASALYDEMIETMKSMGSEELQQKRNEIFQAQKKKAGAQIAWPRNEEGWEEKMAKREAAFEALEDAGEDFWPLESIIDKDKETIEKVQAGCLEKEASGEYKNLGK